MARIVLLNKPYGYLSQFTPAGRWRSLAELLPVAGVYAAGRLDADSEGLLVLTDSGAIQHRLADPAHKLAKVYWAQVEGLPGEAALASLRRGVDLADGRTRPCDVRQIDEPAGLWPRDPPIRTRVSIPTCWLELSLREGRNRQVRRMCAAVGHPVLRLVRYAVAQHTLAGLATGQWRLLETADEDAAQVPEARPRLSHRGPDRPGAARSRVRAQDVANDETPVKKRDKVRNR